MENVAKNIQNPQVFLAEAEALVKDIYVGAMDLHKQYERLKNLMLAQQESMEAKENTPPELDDYDYVRTALSELDYRMVDAVLCRVHRCVREVLRSRGGSYNDLHDSDAMNIDYLVQGCAEDIVLRIMKGEKPIKRD